MALDERKGVVIESRAARANSSAQILPCLLDLMMSDDVTRLFLTLCTQISAVPNLAISLERQLTHCCSCHHIQN